MDSSWLAGTCLGTFVPHRSLHRMSVSCRVPLDGRIPDLNGFVEWGGDLCGAGLLVVDIVRWTWMVQAAWSNIKLLELLSPVTVRMLETHQLD